MTRIETTVDHGSLRNRPCGAVFGRTLPAASVRHFFGIALLVLISLLTSSAIEPLINAHAHNDYEHKRPLLDALDQGFCSVEADIYLVDGKLLVAHNFTQVKPERTLQALYLGPLRQRIKQNGGHVYPGGPQVTLLIDLKTKWQTIYPALRTVLKEYSDIITTFEGDVTHTNAILAIITGDADAVVAAADHSRRLHAEVPDSTLAVLPGLGHMIHYSARGQIGRAIDRLMVLASNGPKRLKRMAPPPKLGFAPPL